MSISNVTLDISGFDEHMMKIYDEMKIRFKYDKDAKMPKKEFYAFLEGLGYDNAKQQREIVQQLIKPANMNKMSIIGLTVNDLEEQQEDVVEEEDGEDAEEEDTNTVSRTRNHTRSLTLALRQMKAAISVLDTFTTEEIRELTADDFDSIKMGLKHAYTSIKHAKKCKNVLD